MPHPEQKNRYLELDALRGLAVLLVVFFHFTWGHGAAGFIFKYGNTGVDLFFLISGFVIFMSLTKVKTGKEFVINRVARLYPTYWVSVTISYILINIYYQISVVDWQKLVFTDYLVNLTMIQFYFHVPDVDQSYWTLVIELIFYACILALFYFKLFNRIRLIGFVASCAVVILANFVKSSPVEFMFKWIPFLSYLPLFFSGIIFYQVYHKQGNVLINYLLLAAGLASQIALFDITGRGIFFSHLQYSVMLILFFSLFVLFVNGKLFFLVSRFTLFLGEISFALYLTHEVISVSFLLPFLINKLGLNFWIASCLITLPIIILIASVITYGIEKPLRSKMKSKLNKVFHVTNLKSN